MLTTIQLLQHVAEKQEFYFFEVAQESIKITNLETEKKTTKGI